MERGERRPLTVSLGPSRGRRESKRPRTACRSSSGRSRRLTEQRWVQAPLLHGAPATPQLVVEDDRPPGLGERPERQQVVVGNSRAAAGKVSWLVSRNVARPAAHPWSTRSDGFSKPASSTRQYSGCPPRLAGPAHAPSRRNARAGGGGRRPRPDPVATEAAAVRGAIRPPGRQRGWHRPGPAPQAGDLDTGERARAGLLPRSSPRRGGVKGGGGMWRLGGGFKGGS